MIVTRYTSVKIVSSNMRYWRDLGYDFPNPSPRWGVVPQITVRVDELKIESNVVVDCWCEKCEKFYTNRYSRAIKSQYCKNCLAHFVLIGNLYGTKNKGIALESMRGDKHPRWNPNKSDYNMYRSEVYMYTRLADISTLKNIDKPRALLGVEGGYQLDHIYSIKDGFDNNIPPSIIGNIKNLQIIPSKENRIKWHKSEITLKEFLQKLI